MEDDLYFELFGDTPENLFFSEYSTSQYLLPVNFKQGNILYSMNGKELDLEIFYNQLNPKKNFDSN